MIGRLGSAAAGDQAHGSKAGPRVLFVSHEATRTGAPLMLLWCLRWMRDHSDLDFSVVLRQGGELASEFAKVAPVSLVYGEPPGTRTPQRVLRRLGWADQALKPTPTVSALERLIRVPARRAVVRQLRRRVTGDPPPELVYLNSVNSSAVLPLIASSARIITHAHELSYNFRYLRRYEPRTLEQMLARTDQYVAASYAVKRALTDDLGVDPNKIEVSYECLPIDELSGNPAVVSDERKDLGLSAETLVVGSVGVVGWRKGPDLFIQVAKRVVELLPDTRDVAFIWVGPTAAWGDWWEGQLQHDLEQTGLGPRVHFIGPRHDAREVMALFDVFALTSRSDAFPLVCLEAAELQKPVVCFDAGGMTEFLPTGERLVLPYLDVDGMAGRIAELLESESERRSLGEGLRRRVRQHHQVSDIAPALLNIIQRTLEGGRGAAR